MPSHQNEIERQLPQLALVPAASLAELQRQVEHLAAVIEAKGVEGSDASTYVEPGPGRPRQYFSAAELAERWGWGLTKVYELTHQELPRFKRGQLVRFHWTYVWAFEGRISRESAERIFESDAI